MNSKALKYLISGIFAYANVFALGILKTHNPTEAFYLGVDSWGFSYESIFWFGISFFFLFRFQERYTERNNRRLVFSSILGVLLSIATVWGTYLVYPEYSIFDSGESSLIQVMLIVGIAFFTVPFSDEVFVWFDSKTNVNKDTRREKNYWSDKKLLYFLLVWLVSFALFLPMFLHFWPGAFGVDAKDQLADYLGGSMSDHHPIMHTLLMGWAYDIGVSLGNVSKGYQLYTIAQMLILSASFAFFAEYLLEKKVKKQIRIFVILLFIINPMNSYFAILSAKVTLAGAFMLFSLTFLLRLFDSFGKTWVNSILFAFSAVLCCLFRNNAIYAYILGGLFIAFLQKGLRKKILFLILVLAIVVGNFGAKKTLIWGTNAKENVDSCRESLSLPIMCLVRTAINHEDELPKEYLEAINAYVPKDIYSEYTPFLADSIKAKANEQMLRENKIEFLKLFAKVGLRFPGEYIEQFCFLTCGYWLTYEYPYCFSGTTSVFWQTIPLDVEQIEHKDFFSFGGEILDGLYIETERLSVPLFGFFFRGTLYTWFTLFAIMYGVYRKHKGKMAVVAIPFAYLLTVFLAPTSFIRYLYCNVVVLPVLFWVLMSNSISECEIK